MHSGDITTVRPGGAHPAYRPDIDGLRAVAVVPVVLFHAAGGLLPGGFVGVDIFFVISGYLITLMLAGAMADGRFSLLDFYERRARRIMPALLVVLAAVLLAACALFLPSDLTDTGQSIVATLGFASNLLFYLEAGYFAPQAILKPLLHTWSLAVEEQFYIAFPLFLWTLMRFWRRGTIWVTAAAAVASFLLAATMLREWPTATFYLPFARAWELLLGSLVALAPAIARPGRVADEATGLVGLALIIASIALLTPETPFPGLAALPACAGAAMLIASGSRHTIAARLLAWRPLVEIGLISYSLYLWHWPLIVFQHYVLSRPPLWWETAGIVVASGLTAWASWRFVETPVRTRAILARRGSLFLACLVAGAVLAVGAVTAWRTGGLPQRLPAEVVRLDRERTKQPSNRGCSPMRTTGASICRLGGPGAPRFALWGDSHAHAMRAAFDDQGVPGIILHANGCPPLAGIQRPGHYTDCLAYNSEAISLLKAMRVPQVLLVANWESYADRDPRFVGGDLDAALATAARAVAPARVTLIDRVPGAVTAVPGALARAELFDRGSTIGYTRAQAEARARGWSRFTAAARVPVLSPLPYLCDRRRCPVVSNRRAIYSDNAHMTPAGAALLRPLAARALGRTHGT